MHKGLCVKKLSDVDFFSTKTYPPTVLHSANNCSKERTDPSGIDSFYGSLVSIVGRCLLYLFLRI